MLMRLPTLLVVLALVPGLSEARDKPPMPADMWRVEIGSSPGAPAEAKFQPTAPYVYEQDAHLTHAARLGQDATVTSKSYSWTVAKGTLLAGREKSGAWAFCTLTSDPGRLAKHSAHSVASVCFQDTDGDKVFDTYFFTPIAGIFGGSQSYSDEKPVHGVTIAYSELTADALPPATIVWTLNIGTATAKAPAQCYMTREVRIAGFDHGGFKDDFLHLYVMPAFDGKTLGESFNAPFDCSGGDAEQIVNEMHLRYRPGQSGDSTYFVSILGVDAETHKYFDLFLNTAQTLLVPYDDPKES